VCALLAGFGLRAAFVAHHPRFAGDSLIYGELAHNMLVHHVYGLMDDVLHPTLIRLPGYPLFLAACFRLLGDANYLGVLWVQVVVDLATCGLIAALVRRIASERAGMWALWLSALCPFTANYAAVALAETCSLFCVALAFYALERWVSGGLPTSQNRDPSAGSGQAVGHPEMRWVVVVGLALAFYALERWVSGGLPTSQNRDPSAGSGQAVGHPEMRWVVVVGLALAWAVLLRPDEGLLAAAVVPVMLWVGVRTRERGVVRRIAPAVVASLFVALPLAMWGARNWRVFHVVQPLAPKYANDPGEEVAYGFMRWYRTWAIGFPATVNVYWEYDGSIVKMSDLPARAFDSPEQREETAALYARYNEEQGSTAPVDAEFARLAAERVRAHPVRYYVVLPVARELDMWFRPRTELMKVPLDWWRVRERPRASAVAIGFAVSNVLYLALAVWGLLRWRRARWNGQAAVACAMGLFFVLRCALLLTIDNSEMRYTLECYPVVLVLCGMVWMRSLSTSGER
jgi:hypothetical protein